MKMEFKLALLIFFAVVIIAIILGYFAFSFYAASQIVKANHDRIDISPTIISTDYKDISVQNSDGVDLKGWLFKGSSNKLIIMIAGFRQNRINKDYFGFLIAKELIVLGYNVLVFDNQSTGESVGDYLTFGVKEGRDLVTVVNYAKNNGFEAKNIGIIGDSMGAIALLLVSDQLKDIGAMAVDSPANDLKKTMENILQNEQGVPLIFNPGIFFILKTVYQVDVDSIKPSDHVALVPGRVFLYLHGGKDTSIYPWNSEQLLAVSNPKSELVIFPNGKHIETYKSDPQKYRDTVFPFLEEQLGK
jgi:uncharacterized protein